MPAAAEEEVVYSDDFESGTVGNNVGGAWRISTASWFDQIFKYDNAQNHTSGGSKSAYSVGYDSGTLRQGIGAWSDNPKWGPVTNGRAEVWFYDDMVGSVAGSEKRQYVSLDDSTGNYGVGVMVRTATSRTRYVTFLNGAYAASSVDRALGWHKASWIRDSSNQTYIYVDGVLVATATSAQLPNFADFDLGSWTWDSGNYNTKMWFDDCKVVRGQNQSRYRWFSNTNSEPVAGDALAAENTAITGVANGTVLRLRLQVQNDMSYSWVGSYVALRYREGTTGAWTNLGSSAHWNYANGLGSNGSQVTTTLLTSSTVKQHYVENSPSVASASVGTSAYTEWDFSVTPVWSNVAKGADYYFKLVVVDGAGNYVTDLVSYPQLPQAATSAGKTWNGGTSTSWNNALNWTPNTSVPGASDDVYIPNVGSNPTLDVDATVASLTLAAGKTLNLNDATARALTISGNASFGGTVNQTTSSVSVGGSVVTVGGTYNHTGAGTFTANSAALTVGTGVTYTMSGAAGNVSVQSLVLNGRWLMQTSNNTLTVTDLTINAGGEFQNTVANTSSIVDVSGTLTNNGTMDSTTGGNFRFTGTTAIAGSSSSTKFYRYTLVSGTCTVSSTGSPALTVLGGSVVLTAGTLSAAGKTLVVQGNWQNDGAAFSGSGSTVRFTGNSSNIDSGTAQTSFHSVEGAKTAGQTLTAATRDLIIAGSFSLTSGNFAPGNYTHTVGGDWNDSGTSGGFVPAAGTIVLNGASPTVTTHANNYFYNLTVSTSGTAAMGSSELDVNGSLVVSAGAGLNCGSSAANDVAGTTTVAGTLDMGNGTTNLRGAVTVNSGGQLVLQPSGSAAPTVRIGNGAAAGSLTVAGTLRSSGATRPTLTDQGSQRYALTVQSGATVNISGLTIDRPDDSGLNIADGATITAIDSCFFTGGSGTNTYLSLGLTSGSQTFSNCDFDTNCQYNVSVPAGGVTVLMADAAGAKGADPAGEANDNDPNTDPPGRCSWVYGKCWIGGTSTLWSVGSNWSGGAVPVSTDSVVIPASGVTNWPQLDMNATGGNAVASLTLIGGATLNLNHASAYTLTINGTASFGGTVNQTTGSVSIGGAAITIGGTYTHSGAGTFSAGSATMTVSSGATYIMSGAGGNVTLQSLVVGGLFRQESQNNTLTVTNLTIDSGGEFRNTQADASSIVDVSGTFTNNGTMSATTGGNFRFAGTTTLAGSSNSTTFYRYTLTSGTCTVSASGSPAFTALGGGGIGADRRHALGRRQNPGGAGRLGQ